VLWNSLLLVTVICFASPKSVPGYGTAGSCFDLIYKKKVNIQLEKGLHLGCHLLI
jgi:hypothetical protein